MTVPLPDPGFEHGRAAMAYLAAKVTGDDETAGLLRATGDAWLMLDWMTAALAGWLACTEINPLEFAARVITAMVDEEAAGGMP